MAPEDIIGDLKNYDEVLVTGPDAALFKDKILAADPTINLVLDTAVPRNLSKAILKLGLERLSTVGPDDIGEGPIYIRRSDAEEALLKKKEEANV